MIHLEITEDKVVTTEPFAEGDGTKVLISTNSSYWAFIAKRIELAVSSKALKDAILPPRSLNICMFSLSPFAGHFVMDVNGNRPLESY